MGRSSVKQAAVDAATFSVKVSETSDDIVPISERELICFDDSAILLKDSHTQEDVVPNITPHRLVLTRQATESSPEEHRSDEQIPTVCRLAAPTPGGLPQARFEDEEAQVVLGRFACQNMTINELSKALELLQERMLSLEQSMTEIRRDSQHPHSHGLASQQDTWVDNLENMLKVLKDARSAAKTIDDLRLENETLKERLYGNTEATFNEIDDEGSGTAVTTTLTIPSEGPLIKAKKKTPTSRRKLGADKAGADKAGAEAGTNIFAMNCDQHESSHLGSLAALREITAAMSQDSLQNQRPPSNEVHYNHGDVSEEFSTRDSMDRPCRSGTSVPASTTSDTKKRPRSDDGLEGGESKDYDVDVALISSLMHQSSENPRPAASFSMSPKKSPRHIPTSTFRVADTDEAMIDPALRSNVTSIKPALSVPDVLSSIENPPTRKKKRKSGPKDKTKTNVPAYDSEHERRINEHRARDALRKQKVRAASLTKKRIESESKFIQNEKIRERDRMVKEVMAREEMLEQEDDL